ncbi:MAG: RimK family protein [Phycisphaerales bacterium]|nr:RimK family protein [Phycisphaerales bacterium]
MSLLIVVNNPSNWPLTTPGVEVVSARAYISDVRYSERRSAKIFNLCRSYRYQSLGYYVSLLAEARGHKCLPSISTIQDLKSLTMMRLAAEDLEELIQKSLGRMQTDTFVLSIYFGRNIARRYDRLSLKLFNLFPAPLLRAHFARDKDREWTLQSIAPISASDIPPEHLEFVLQGAEEYFAGRRQQTKKALPRYDLAILFNPDAAVTECPSSEETIAKFIRAAKRLGIAAEVIGKDDYGKLAEFDALFIRETTYVNHYTYRFSRKAAAEGLVVIDDPNSIVKCSNKVFLAESLAANDIRAPRTFIVHRDNIEDIPLYVGFPCVLKQPDSSFSQGVIKVDDPAALERETMNILARSDLIIAQEFLPSDYDWRVGVLDRQPLYVCKYHMVRGHWQIAKADSAGRRRFGRVEGLPIESAPRSVVKAAVNAANLIGDGLYGVDVKQVGSKAYVIEVNDNPNVDVGCEDRILRDDLYDRVMRSFLRRLDHIHGPPPDAPSAPAPSLPQAADWQRGLYGHTARPSSVDLL